ncbi:MAG TPA: YqgE/AlgH family protein [Ignavibacteria bacterium]|nr:YqgE/AlgH family protein [Ignavibacteria bacterium]
MDTKVKSGDILISTPALTEVFSRSVVFMTEHDINGSVGVIINKKLEYNLKDIVEAFSGIDAPVYFGGPVQTELVSVLHRIGDKIGGFEISDGIYYGCDADKLNDLAEIKLLNLDDIKFFLGYAGWSEGQLINEIEHDSWFISKGLERYIFDTDVKDLWSKTLNDMGKKYKLISMYPENPSLN